MNGEAQVLPAVLAVDGGNSKTDVALVEDDGRVLGLVRSPGTSHEHLGLGGSLAALERVVRVVGSAVGPRAPGIVAEVGSFCLAGLDLPVDDRIVGEAIRDRSWARRVTVRNDAFAILRAGTERGWGVALVCGAGMNCVGVSPDGRTVRFPALGVISGDFAAGGGWMGPRALGVAIRARDGRGKRTSLERLVPDFFGLESPATVLEAIRTGRLDEGRLVELPPVVFAAASAGDDAACALIEEMTGEIVALVAATMRRLDMTSSDADVVLGGGVFRTDAAWFVDRIASGVRKVARRARVSTLGAPALLGAALLGLDEAGASSQAIRRLREELTHSRLVAAPRVPAASADGLDGEVSFA